MQQLRGAGAVNLITKELYCDVFDQLERERVRYVVVGGLAVVLHGHARPTFDLDIVIDPAPDEIDRALNALMRGGFVPSLPLPLSMLSMMRMFDKSEREVDVFVRYHIPFKDLWAGSKCVSVCDSVARVMSLEHLLQMMRFSGRPQDLLDIEGLLAHTL